MRVGRLLGAEVRIDPLLAVLAGLAVALGYLPEVAIFVSALILHELGHLVVAAAEEVPVARLVVHPLGAVAHIPALAQLERRVALAVSLAGPATSLTMAGLGALVLRHGPAGAAASERLGLWLDMNLGLGLLNLVPVLPLDGGQAVRAHLAAAGRLARDGRRLVAAGRALGIAVAAAALALSVAGRPLWDVALFGLWLVVASAREGRSLAYGRAGALEARRAALRRGGVLVGRTLVASPSVSLGQVWRAMAPRAYHEVRVVDGAGEVVAAFGEARIYEALVRLGPEATLAALMDDGAGPDAGGPRADAATQRPT